MRLQDKVAIITGSSKGIGAGIAKEFAKEGAKVVINYANAKDDAEKVVAEISQNGGTAIAMKADVSKKSDIEQLFSETKKAFGTLDILVNNAGVWRYELLEQITEESFHAQVNTNLMGTIFCSQEAVKLMGEKGGSIINISSTMSLNPLPLTLVYAVAKAGIDNLTKVLAKELGPKNIRVNAIGPGMTVTEGATADGRPGSEMEIKLLGQTPLGRLGYPEDMAKVALFFASDDSAWVTGERVTAAGGLL